MTAGTNDVVEEVLASEESAELDGVDDDALDEQGAPSENAITEENACGPITDMDDVDVPKGVSPFPLISELAGVKLMYGRNGDPEPRKFPVDPDFKDQLERTVQLVVRRAPAEFGELRSLTSAGMMVKKPNSLHADGRACDWDVWKFAHVKISPFDGDHADPSLAVRRRYWSLAALCRSSSAYILHAEFNDAHKDHIHQDNGAMLPFDATSGTTVKLVQAVCNVVFDAKPKLSIDGVFGEKTKGALAEALETVHLNGDVTGLATWRRFLRRSGHLGFRLSV
jgi:hypothetical protein